MIYYADLLMEKIVTTTPKGLRIMPIMDIFDRIPIIVNIKYGR